MTENPNTVNPLTGWTEETADAATIVISEDIWDQMGPCISYQDIIGGYYNISEPYEQENLPICYEGRIWFITAYPVTEYTNDMPPAFASTPVVGADWELSTIRAVAFDIFAFPEDVINYWLVYGDSFDEIFSPSAIEYIEVNEKNFDTDDFEEFVEEDEDLCLFW